jgi:hypothetical protein
MRRPPWYRGSVMALAAAGLVLIAATGTATAGTAQRNAAPVHRVHCVLAAGHLYLGSAGATQHRRTVTCTIRFYQLTPNADGVIVALHGAGHHTSYSVAISHLSLPPTGRATIAWLTHPGPAKLHCALIRHHLYLGSAGAGTPRRTVTCTIRFYQLTPHADGVIVNLQAAGHKNSYSIAIEHLPAPPTGRTLLRWLA